MKMSCLNEEIALGEKLTRVVKESNLPDNPVTIGEVFEKVFDQPSWMYFKTGPLVFIQVKGRISQQFHDAVVHAIYRDISQPGNQKIFEQNVANARKLLGEEQVASIHGPDQDRAVFLEAARGFLPVGTEEILLFKFVSGNSEFSLEKSESGAWMGMPVPEILTALNQAM